VRFLKPLLIAFVYSVFVVGGLEIGLRLWYGVAPFEIVNFRSEHKVDDEFKGFMKYDSNLGWSMRADMDTGSMGTLAHGIRRNAKTQTALSPGGWLVSGSSFTAGSGADDANTWPALLQALEGTPVHNAAVGGFGLDQVVLRAESLLDVLQPEMLMIDLMQTTISWTGYSVLTRPKPYFVVEEGELKRPVAKVPLIEDKPVPVSGFWHYAAYFYLVDRVMASLDAQTWYARTRESVVNAPGDPVEVSCALLERIARKTAERNIRLLIVSIPTGQEMEIAKEPASVVAQVEQCATDAGLQIVPVRQRMHDDFDNGNVKPVEIFQLSGDRPIGHMTIRGNEYVAQIIHETLKVPFVAKARTSLKTVAVREGASVPEGTGGNLLENSENLAVMFSPTQSAVLRIAENGAPETKLFRLQGLQSDPQTKPTIVSRYIGVEAGQYVLSMEIKPETVQRLTLQVSSKANGSLTTGFDLKRNVPYVLPAHVALGRDWKAKIEKREDGWFRVSLRMTLPKSEIQLLPGLGNEHGAMAVGAGEASVLVRAMQLEHGGVATDYIPTRGAAKAKVVGSGINLLADAENLHEHVSGGDIVTFSKDGFFNFFSSGAFELAPIGGDSEHYLRFQQNVEANQSYIFSFEVKRKGASPLRIQMFDGSQDGAYADFDFASGVTSAQQIGKNTEFLADMSEAAPDGWQKILLTIPVNDPKLILTIQSLDEARRTKFSPDGEVNLLRNFRLEKRVVATE